ncbi:MAG: carbamoyltransferase HypF [Halodesulfurarchaeum sp.]
MNAETDAVRAFVSVTGVVQGVGFRPFVYRTAVDYGLGGWVKNTGDAGVEIVVEGDRTAVDAFLDELENAPPPLSRIDDIVVRRTDPEGDSSFEIVPSSDAEGGSGTIPPDTGICARCLQDVRDPDSRYYGYWATSCVDCGPRYTVIRSLPYDRPTTSMDAFPMCVDCRSEYEDPGDRRYHAQTIACPECGPTLTLSDPDGREWASGPEAIWASARRLESGEILAIKGIGGTHVACMATDVGAVEELRARTGRPAKPFAIMAPSLESVTSFARVSAAEKATLESTRRPIVLLETRSSADWLEAVAPGLHTVGAMLPYSGLHHLLFEHLDEPIVLTSANRPGRPMCLTRESILDRLGDVVDGVLDHDREIVARCDDSVVRFTGGERRFVRRSRGWVPERIPFPGAIDAFPDVLALGPEFDVTVAVTQEEEVVPSQHVGDVDDPETLTYHRSVVEHLVGLLGVSPSVVAHDLHPDFLTTAETERYATDGVGNGGPLQTIAVQHHHAHAASLLGEHDVERAIVIAADGTGYGPDGTIWGGEVLDAGLDEYERIGGLGTFRLPGGDAAIERPARILADLLDDEARIDDLLVSRGAVPDRESAAVVRRQAERDVNAPKTTSAGRFLDAISALLGVCTERHYEGEPAMKLEAVAASGEPLPLDVPYTTRDGNRVVATKDLARQIATLAEGHPIPDVAATAQRALADGLAELAVAAAVERDLDAVGFTGGVAYNDAILRRIRERVRDRGLRFLSHDLVPPGDAGISYGQAVVATRRSER